MGPAHSRQQCLVKTSGGTGSWNDKSQIRVDSKVGSTDR